MKHLALVGSMLVVLTAFASPAAAEWFLDLYLGLAATQGSTVDTTFPGGVTITRDLDVLKNVTAGARGGYWFLKPEWIGASYDIDVGVALDVSVFAPTHDTTVIPISALATARTSLLKDEEFPKGRLQPYVAAGPSIFVSSVNGTFGPVTNVSDTSVDLGFDFRAGAAYRLTGLFTVFAEYRFTHVGPEFSFPSVGGNATSSASFNTHHLLTGLGFRF